MIEEPCEGGVNLREGEGGMVVLDGVGAPAVADMFLRNLDDSDAAVVNPRGAGGVAVDMGEGFAGHPVRRIKAAGRWAIRALRRRPLRSAVSVWVDSRYAAFRRRTESRAHTSAA